MKKKRVLLLLTALTLLTACDPNAPAGTDTGGEPPGSEAAPRPAAQLDLIDMTAWNYNAEDHVYWQTGLAYCANPADAAFENLGVYVPGAYMTAADNGDGTYTCQVNELGAEGGFTAKTAPIVIPVDTPGYSAMAAPTGYSSAVSAYTNAGFVYVAAGCRGRDAGAPAGVTDLKAAIRYIRYVNGQLPGSAERIFSFGMSGGGAQSALLGATGDSELYTPYLEAIGAVSGVSDAVAGSMCWCPITNLDYASEAYEWNLGVTRGNLSDDMRTLSDAMAERFALYINELGLTDENGDPLTLTASEEGIYQAGSYYDYLKNVIETSLNDFLADTTFPFTVSGGLPGRGEGAGRRDGPNDFPVEGENFGGREIGGKGGPKGDRPDLNGAPPDMDADYHDLDGIGRNDVTGGVVLSGTYETAQDYIDALNRETNWVIYDSAANSASITSIAGFVCALKAASKDVGAFDALDASQGENILFGYGDGGAHFDAAMAELLTGTEYAAAYAADLARTDALGSSAEDRVNMYNPLYFLSEYYDGCGTANVAGYWRIRSGINQSDTALSTEVNLALALERYGARVDFAAVWGQAHVKAERTGDSTSNFIAWVAECCQ